MKSEDLFHHLKAQSLTMMGLHSARRDGELCVFDASRSSPILIFVYLRLPFQHHKYTTGILPKPPKEMALSQDFQASVIAA
jgi:hypothetical protein